MNVIYLTHDGLTDPLGQSQIIPYLRGLSKLGYKITIVSSEKPERLRSEGELVDTMLRESGIVWVSVKYSNRFPVISPILTLLRLYRAAIKLAGSKKFELSHCRSTLPALIGNHLRHKFQIPLLFDMRGFWADERVEGNIWPQKNPLFRFLYSWVKKQEKVLLQKSEHIISLTQAGKIIIEQKYSVRHPVSVIPCCADFLHFDYSKINSAAITEKKSKLDIPLSSRVIIYTGSIGTWYMLEEMMAFFRIYNKKFADSIFLIVTKENHEGILATARRYNVHNSIRLTSSGRNEMPLFLALADISLYFIRPGYSKQASSPVKQGESLAMGIPVVTNSGIGDSDTIIASNNMGWLVTSFSDASYADIIEHIVKRDREEIRKNASSTLSLDAGIKKYSTVYAECIKNQ